VTEVYAGQVAEHEARFAGSARPEVYITADDSLPQGRYRLRQGLATAQDPVGTGSAPGWGYPEPAQDPAGTGSAPGWGYPEPAPAAGYAQPVGVGTGGLSWYEVDPSRTIMDGGATVMEQIRPMVPVLRLVTGSSVTETSTPGARAGRGPVELVLPDVPTVSREHARFTFSEGRWRVTNLGRNGLYVNGVPVSGEQSLSDGDSIRWGTRPDAPQSRIEIG
jgi:FHA domain